MNKDIPSFITTRLFRIKSVFRKMTEYLRMINSPYRFGSVPELANGRVTSHFRFTVRAKLYLYTIIQYIFYCIIFACHGTVNIGFKVPLKSKFISTDNLNSIKSEFETELKKSEYERLKLSASVSSLETFRLNMSKSSKMNVNQYIFLTHPCFKGSQSDVLKRK